MLEVGRSFCEALQASYGSVRSHIETRSNSEPLDIEPDLLVMSKVLNEGDGNDLAAAVFDDVVARASGNPDIVVIEIASEASSRQMCNLARGREDLDHIGPCPSAGSRRNLWGRGGKERQSYRNAACRGHYPVCSRL